MMSRITASRICGSVLCSALLLALDSSAAATTIMRMSVERMAQVSPVIVHARCLENSVAWDAGEIWTFAGFEVLEVWRGSPPAQLTVRLLGGRSGNLTSHVSGVPHFRPGEEVVLFLEPSPRGGFSIVSWQQGTFRIRRDPATNEETVAQDTASFATFDYATRRFEEAGIRNLPLEILRARVEAALRAAPSRNR